MKTFFYKASAWLSTIPLLAFPYIASAQIAGAQSELEEVVRESGSQATDLPKLVGRLINVFISALGIVFVILIVYAGFLYLTAGGNDDNIKKAKKLLAQSIIGLIIIIAAYAISTFVFGALATATAA